MSGAAVLQPEVQESPLATRRTAGRMYAGRIVEAGSAEEVFRRRAHP